MLGLKLPSAQFMRRLAAALAVLALVLAAPASAPAATLQVDPVKRCYREQGSVFLAGSGFTPNAEIVFSRDGRTFDSIQADPSGALSGTLTLPGLVSGQRPLTYTATDSANPANTTSVTLLVTATRVKLRPERGAPHRLLRVTGRGFFGGRTLWAHVIRPRQGARRPAARNVRIGRVKGACGIARARKRLFPAGARPGRYRVQFDTFRRYRAARAIEYEFSVRIL
jgi:hypothetical protein